MSNFLDFPEKIKVKIYRYCLVIKEKMVPEITAYDREAGTKPLPCSHKELGLSLFAVNKAIRKGALDVFYGENTFELSYTNIPGSCCIWKEHGLRFRHISVNLDRRDLDPDHSIIGKHIRDPNFASGQQEIADDIHKERIHQLSSSWRWKVMILGYLHLKSLQIDVGNLYCLQGCCRLVRQVFEEGDLPYAPINCPEGFFVEWHRHDNTVACNWDHRNHRVGEPKGLATMNIKVVGTKDEEETAYMHSLGFACEHCPMVGRLLDNRACMRNDGSISNGNHEETSCGLNHGT